MKGIEDEIEQAVQALRNGKVILYPTDTIWGLGCDATNSRAVERLFRIKRKKEQGRLIALIDSPARLSKYLSEVPDLALDLIQYAANPISIVFPRGKNLAKNMLGADGSVCFRVTNDPFCIALVERFDKPVASGSANLSGQPTPLFFAAISSEIIQAVDHVVKLNQDKVLSTKATSIIRLEPGGQFSIIRS